MTKDECKDLVQLVHAMWSKEMPANLDLHKTIYKAWWLVLQESPYNQLEAILVKLNKTERFMPTPGTVWEHWQQTQQDAQPTATQAWNLYCHIRDTVNSGTAQPDTVIPVKLQQVIRIVRLNLSTGADRTHFTETYNQHITRQ